MGRACIVGYWRNPTWIPQVSPGGTWGETLGGEEGEGTGGGALQKELQKVQAGQLDSGIPGEEESVQKFSVQR